MIAIAPESVTQSTAGDLHALCAAWQNDNNLKRAQVASAVAAGADVNAREHQWQRTPLLSAASAVVSPTAGKQMAPIIGDLLAAGANAAARDGTNFGALSVAHHLPIETVRTLVAAGAPGDVQNTGTAALVLASRADAVETARLLLRAGALLHDGPENGPQPYIDQGVAAQALAAARSGAMVRLLVAHGASVYHRDAKNNTPLHLQDAADAVVAFLDCGAVLEARNCLGRTPLLSLGERGPADRVRCALALLAGGADPRQRDDCGQGMLDYPEVRLDTELLAVITAAQAAWAARAALRVGLAAPATRAVRQN